MNALIDACRQGDVPAEVVLVVAPNDTSQAVELATTKGIEVAIVPYQQDDYATALLTALKSKNVEWICLAGYMKLLPVEVLQAFPNRILNIHPALLPKFGGKGMYGMHVHEAVIASGDKESGCSIHLVNERYDEGQVIFQLKCPVEEGDTPETLAARVLKLEHQAFAQALKGAIERNGR
jgi:formyltetrahydrofolate-dependent phosphoribosylglycinamide formyltransferase